MPEINYLEWIGYIGSVIVAISLTMTSMVKLRWLNFIGALIFTIYGVAIQAIPVALVNGFITIIDVYYLYKMYTTKDYFKIMESNNDATYLNSFLSFYEARIKKHFPEFSTPIDNDAIVLFILRNMAIAGVFIAHKENENTLMVDLDYAIPSYQDFKTGRFLFIKNSGRFTDKGITQLKVKPSTKSQIKYYSKMGFIPSGEVYNKHL